MNSLTVNVYSSDEETGSCPLHVSESSPIGNQSPDRQTDPSPPPYSHTHTQRCINACLHSRTHPYTHTHRHTPTHPPLHTHTHLHTHHYTPLHTHTHTHTRTHTHTHPVTLLLLPVRTEHLTLIKTFNRLKKEKSWTDWSDIFQHINPVEALYTSVNRVDIHLPILKVSLVNYCNLSIHL